MDSGGIISLFTWMPLVQLHSQRAEAIDQRKLAIGIFHDLAKARFDTVNHPILIKNNQSTKVFVIFEWVKSYLVISQLVYYIGSSSSL